MLGLGSRALYLSFTVWAYLASRPPFGRNVEIGSYNRGLFGPKMASSFVFLMVIGQF